MSEQPDLHFFITRQFQVNPLPFDGQPEDEDIELRAGIYSDVANLLEFNLTFSRYGIPEGWTVTVLPQDVINSFWEYEGNCPEHIRTLFNLPLTSKMGNGTRWKHDFREAFNLDHNFNPIIPNREGV